MSDSAGTAGTDSSVTTLTNKEVTTDTRTTSTNSSSSVGTAEGIVNQGKSIYKLPYDFFVLTTGLVPQKEEVLKQRWHLRKNRQVPDAPLIDEESFDRRAMVRERESVRESLRNFAHHEYMEHVKEQLCKHGILSPYDDQPCRSLLDVCRMIHDKPNLHMGLADIMFEIFHYKHAAWTSNTVDAWARMMNIDIVLPPVVITLKRQPNKQYYRGCFNHIVNERRMQDLKRIT
jgi:hypothetical protein